MSPPYAKPVVSLTIINRKCVGLNFGDKIVKVVLATIIENYQMELKDNYFTENKEMFFHGPKGTMILTPRDGRKI